MYLKRIPRWPAVAMLLAIGGVAPACGVRPPGDRHLVVQSQGAPAQTGSCFETPAVAAPARLPAEPARPELAQHVINEATALSRAAVEAAREGKSQQAVSYLQMAKAKLVGLDLNQMTVAQRTQVASLLDQIDQALARVAG